MKNSITLKLTLCTFLLLLLSTCNDDDPIQYQLTTQVTPAETGTLTPLSGLYNEGTEIELNANPNEEYIFLNWTGDASGDENPLKIVMLEDKSITAVFEKLNYSLTINITGKGAVIEKIVQAKSSSKDYESGTTVQLNAVPDAEWKFVEWSGDHTGTENPIQLKMDQAKNITAKFEKVSYSLTIEVEGNGQVNQEIVQAKSSSNDYQSGTKVELTAIPENEWEFVGWSGDLTSTKNPIQITIDEPMSIVATFEDDDLKKIYVPDDRFEQALIDLGYDDQLDDYVYKKRITNVEQLKIENRQIEDLTGIEGFESLIVLDVSNNNLINLDVSNNVTLQFLNCSYNQLASMDISQNINLSGMDLRENSFTCLQATEIQITRRLAPTPFAPEWLTDDDVVYSLDCYSLFYDRTYVPDDNFEQVLIDLGYDDVLDDYAKTSIIAGVAELDLSEKNITDLTGIEDFIMLWNLNCRDNNLTQLDVSKNYSLTFGTLDCTNNNITCVQIGESQSNVFGLGISLDWSFDDGTTVSLDCGY